MGTYDYRFSIAGRGLALCLPRESRISEDFAPFRCEGPADLTVEFRPAETLPPLTGAPVFRGVGFSVFRQGEAFLRRYYEPAREDRPYAVSGLTPAGGTVRFLPEAERVFREMNRCFLHVALEELLLRWDRLILHASFVDSPYGGLLFSGPSGIGKSTQAALWRDCRGSTVINGDKPILGREAGVWTAWGSPFAGSSRCYVPRREPVAAIFLLEQGPDCRVERLLPGESFRGLYAGTVINSWNRAYVKKACDLLLDLACRVPVYRLRCTPDAAAVEAVERTLAKGEKA